VTHHFWKLGFKVQSIDNDPFSNSTMKADILSVEPTDLKVVPDVIWASPPCQTYSNMAGGKHRSREKPEKSQEALEHNFFFAQMAKIMRFTRARHPHAIFIIENPIGLMAHMPLMAALEKELGLYKVMVDYCAFGRDEKKPTFLWTNDRGLHARLSGFRCTHPPGSHENVRRNAHVYDYSSIPEALASLVASYVFSKFTLDGVRDRPAHGGGGI
jgi:site-specific DNA-cytosine methylase